MNDTLKQHDEDCVQIEENILKYNMTLKDGQNKLRIYPWGELDFDQVYVIPRLAKTPEPDDEIRITEDEQGNVRTEVSNESEDESVELVEDISSEYLQEKMEEALSPSLIGSEEERIPCEEIEHVLPGTPNIYDAELLFDVSGQHYSISKELSNKLSDTLKRNAFFDQQLLMTTISAGFHKGKTTLSHAFPELEFYNHLNEEMERETQIGRIFENDNIVYIVGGAGYGKSLFLKKLCVSPQLLSGFTEEPLLIIRGEIKRLVRNDGTRRTMQEFLVESFIHNSLCDSREINPNFITECLQKGRCMLLLDALDEVSNEHREVLHDLIISQFTNIYPGNKVCITSRERGFIPRKNITCFYIRPVTPQDIEEYVSRFIAINKFDRQLRKGFVAEATELVNKKFVKGFLTLSLLLAIYHKEGRLPNNKLQLYEKCFEYMANQREKEKDRIFNSKTEQNYDWENLDKFLTDETFIELAKYGTPNNKDISERSIKKLMLNMYRGEFSSSTACKLGIEEFLQFCADRTEVFIQSQNSNSDYRFYHRSFYEYFYAKYIEANAKSEEEAYEMLRCFDMDSEIFELLTMLYDNEGDKIKNNSLAEYLFEKAHKSLSNGTNQVDRGFDMLVMLLNVVNDEVFHQRFIDLFLQHAEILSGQMLTVNFGMLSTILTRNTAYYISQFGGRLGRIQDRILQYYLNNIKECNTLLKKVSSRKHETITREDLNAEKIFTFNELILILPNCYEILDDFFTKLADRKHLIAVERLQNREVNVLFEFASKVNNLSPKNRIQVYHYLIQKA